MIAMAHPLLPVRSMALLRPLPFPAGPMCNSGPEISNRQPV